LFSLYRQSLLLLLIEALMFATATAISLRQKNDMRTKRLSGIATETSLEPSGMKAKAGKQFGIEKAISSEQKKPINKGDFQ
jgi:hypothetical protein